MTWDEYFLSIAEVVSRKSKDNSTKVGCVLVDQDNRPVSHGYNGFPQGVPDMDILLEDRATKLRLVLHAEINSIIFARTSLKGCTAYVYPIRPCAQCAAALIQAGIKRIVAPACDDERNARWADDFALADWMYNKAGVDLVLMEHPKDPPYFWPNP